MCFFFFFLVYFFSPSLVIEQDSTLRRPSAPLTPQATDWEENRELFFFSFIALQKRESEKEKHEYYSRHVTNKYSLRFNERMFLMLPAALDGAVLTHCLSIYLSICMFVFFFSLSFLSFSTFCRLPYCLLVGDLSDPWGPQNRERMR